MTLTLPQLDDRRFSDLVAEMRSLIPRYDRTWTNHNPADPGMTLVELFAWLAEMVMYRLNRVEERTYHTFLELLGVQPAAAIAEITFELDVPKDSLPETFVIAQGTRAAAHEENTGEKILFETRAAIPLSQARWDADRSVWIFTAQAMNTIDIEEEFLGVSTGRPNQELILKAKAIFLDRENERYHGNPKVFMDDGASFTTWEYRQDLLDSKEMDSHFTVAHLPRVIRFGDGVRGRIPPQGAKIFCSYRCLGGSQGNVKAKSINELEETSIPGLGDLSKVTLFNEYPAEGGVDAEALDDLLTRGLSAMMQRSRAVSREDFETLAQNAKPGAMARVKAVFDRNLEDASAPHAEAHVSLIVLPAADYLWPENPPTESKPDTEPVLLRYTGTGLSAAMAGSKATRLYRDIFAFIDDRRLVTTIVHVVRPAFEPVSIAVTVQAKQGVNVTALADTIRQDIGRFLDPYTGWLDGAGWPFGRKIYRSELYQQIEAMEGVDHVTDLLINGDDRVSAKEVGEFNLVCLNHPGDLSVTVY